VHRLKYTITESNSGFYHWRIESFVDHKSSVVIGEGDCPTLAAASGQMSFRAQHWQRDEFARQSKNRMELDEYNRNVILAGGPLCP
jgi:hypothetical protein